MSETNTTVANYAYCPQCGSPIQPVVRVCPKCGTVTPVGLRDEAMAKAARPMSTALAKASRPMPTPPITPQPMPSPTSERVLVGDGIGQVTDRRVVFRPTIGKVRSEQEISLRHITALNYQVVKNQALGVILVIVGLALPFTSGSFAGGLVFGLAAIAGGVMLFRGRPKISLQTASGMTLAAGGHFWTRGEADEFVAKLREQLYRDATPSEQARWG